MKKAIISIAIITCFQSIGKAQDSTLSKPDTPVAKKAISPLVKKNSWFLELGGAGVALTMNYERFFSKNPGGLSLRAGIGGGFAIIGEGVGFLSLPLGMSYNLPVSKNKEHFIEFGANYTYITGGIIGEEESSGHAAIISPEIGWRHINPKSGWMLRAVLIPVFIDAGGGGVEGPYAGFSFGKKF
jgi:hypothetical protein